MIDAQIGHIIFDLDGTLYSLDGGSFCASSLGTQVKAKYLELISGYSSNPDNEFESYLLTERTSGIPISENIARTLGSTRVEVFRKTWGGICFNTIGCEHFGLGYTPSGLKEIYFITTYLCHSISLLLILVKGLFHNNEKENKCASLMV